MGVGGGTRMILCRNVFDQEVSMVGIAIVAVDNATIDSRIDKAQQDVDVIATLLSREW